MADRKEIKRTVAKKKVAKKTSQKTKAQMIFQEKATHAAPVHPVPEGYTRVACSVYYDDPIAAIDWLCEAFGFENRFKYISPEGKLQHSEVTYGSGFFMVGDAANDEFQASPLSLDKRVSHAMHIYVDDIDAHCKHAKKSGAIIHKAPDERTYGNRVYMAEDCEGHRWWFAEAQVKSVEDGIRAFEESEAK